MVWGDESPEQAVQFDTKVLPPDLQALRDSTLFGLGRVAPEAVNQGESAGNAAVEASPGSAVVRRRLSPRHRRAVGTYFSSAKKR